MVVKSGKTWYLLVIERVAHFWVCSELVRNLFFFNRHSLPQLFLTVCDLVWFL